MAFSIEAITPPVRRLRIDWFRNDPLSFSMILLLYRTNEIRGLCLSVGDIRGSIELMQLQTCVLISQSSEQTEKIAATIGSRLRGGESFELVSDLGGGKTTFTRGLAQGAGSGDVVSSPTFTVSKVYKAPKFEIHHFDFYRLPDAGLATHEVEDLLDDPAVVLVVEWGGVVEHVLPESRIQIHIERTADDGRQLTMRYPSEMSYALEGVC